VSQPERENDGEPATETELTENELENVSGGDDLPIACIRVDKTGVHGNWGPCPKIIKD
jgi:bacteriocin-like protein